MNPVSVYFEKSRAPADFNTLRIQTGLTEAELSRELKELSARGEIIRQGRGKYGTPELFGLIAGKFSKARGSYGFVCPKDREQPDLFISRQDTQDAWNGDVVLAKGTRSDEEGRAAGVILEVLSRQHKTITGTIVKEKKKRWLIPDDKRLPERILALGNLPAGAKAALEITRYGERPAGRITADFGDAGTRDSATNAILFMQGINPDFPPEVLAEAEKAQRELEDADMANRLDLRDRLIFTIDGEDSKDLDDALSLEWDEEGRPVVGVHIADVSHYVKQGSALFSEALRRGTSVYFADRVIPMLPPELSNGICSLHGGASRLTVSVFMTFEPSAQISDRKFALSVIRSSHRLTYAACNDLLEGRVTDSELETLRPVLTQLDRLRKKLEKRREKRGAIDIFSIEGKIYCDENGNPIDLKPRSSGPSERIVESFMIAANETVAEYIEAAGLPNVFRTHEKPDALKILAFYEMAKLLNVSFSGKPEDPKTLQRILKNSRGKPEETVLNSLLLRSMMKAKYSVNNTGHFGLGSDHYCHFTSPIRRFPDLLVHRMLTLCLRGESPAAGERTLLKDAALFATDREIAADSAEREIERLYKAEYMLKFIGCEFEGWITGVFPFGLFVGLENTAEGLCPVSCLPEDEYVPSGPAVLSGIRTGKTFRLGDRVSVRLLSSNRTNGEMEFELLS